MVVTRSRYRLSETSPMGALFLEHNHDPLAVDDLRMVVHPENPRHGTGRIAGEFDNREGIARLALPRDHVYAVAAGRNEIEEAVVDDFEVTPVGQSIRETREPGMRRCARRQDVIRHSAALFRARHGTGNARPAAHQAEGVTDAKQRRGRICARWRRKARKEASPTRRSPESPGSSPKRRRSAAGRDVPGPPVPTYRRNLPLGRSGIFSFLRTSNESTRTFCPEATRASRVNAAASSKAWAMASWPRFGQEWFMSSKATSMRFRAAGGTSPSTRTYSKKSWWTWRSRAGMGPESRWRDAVLGFSDDVVDDRLQVVRCSSNTSTCRSAPVPPPDDLAARSPRQRGSRGRRPRHRRTRAVRRAASATVLPRVLPKSMSFAVDAEARSARLVLVQQGRGGRGASPCSAGKASTA